MAIPAGGSGSYSYAWTVVSSDHPVVIASPTAQTTGLSFTGVGAGVDASAEILCTVTDTVSGLTGSVGVSMSYVRY